MKYLFIIVANILWVQQSLAEAKTIHVFVALCDNKNQGIVPVPEFLGNGQDPNNNLYWGAAFGIENFFKHKSSEWEMVSTIKPKKAGILQRILFKHVSQDLYLLADAYDGGKIKDCIRDFLLASNFQHAVHITHQGKSISFGGNADLLAYVGHNGLMDFKLQPDYKPHAGKSKDVIILACYSQYYFSSELRRTNSKPILLTTNLMAPEAYTLEAAVQAWLEDESPIEIKERAAQAYNRYQKCGIKGARALFTYQLKK